MSQPNQEEPSAGPTNTYDTDTDDTVNPTMVKIGQDDNNETTDNLDTVDVNQVNQVNQVNTIGNNVDHDIDHESPTSNKSHPSNPSNPSNPDTPPTDTSIEVPVDVPVDTPIDAVIEPKNDSNELKQIENNQDNEKVNDVNDNTELDDIKYVPDEDNKDDKDNQQSNTTELIMDNGETHKIIDSDNGETDLVAGVGNLEVQTQIKQTKVAEYKHQIEVTDTINPPDNNDEEDGSKTSKCIDNSGNYIVYGLICSTLITTTIAIIINGASGVFDDSGSELGAIIGLTCTNMILTPILVLTVGYYGFVLTITECSAVWILLLTLILLLVEFVYFAINLPQYAFFYITYVVMKVVLMYQFYFFTLADVKYYGSQVIKEFLKDKTFITKDSQLIRLVPGIILIIIIQMILFMLGCLAFVGGLNNLFELKLIVFLLLVWSIKSLTHYLHIIVARAVTFVIDPKSRLGIKTNNSKFQQRVRSMSEIMYKMTSKDGDDKQTVDTVTAVKTETVELAENGPAGQINVSGTRVNTLAVETDVLDGNSNDTTNTVQDEINAIEVENNDTQQISEEAKVEDTTVATVTNNNVGLDSDAHDLTQVVIDNDNNTITTTKVEMNKIEVGELTKISSNNNLILSEDKFDPILSSFSDASGHVASTVMGSPLVTFSSIPNLLANLGQATKLLSRVVATGCLCCAYICDDDDGNGNSCFLISGIIWLLSFIAHALEKISKFLLQYTNKTILTSAGFRNVSFCKALSDQKRMLSETKEKFGTKMLLLDNALAQHATHLILLCSSFGAWITIWSGYPEYAPLIHISGYLTGRTAYEMFDVIQQLWLVIWYLEPSLLNPYKEIQEVLIKRTCELILTENGETKTREQIEIEIRSQYNVIKDTSGITQNVAQQNEKIIISVEQGQTQEQALAAVIGNETGSIATVR